MAIFEVAPDISGGRRKIILKSPATLEPIGELECQTKADVDQAVAKARAAQPAWGALSLEARVAYMNRLKDVIIANQDRIIETVVRETGKPLQDAMVFEVYAVCDFIAYWCKQAVKVLKDEKVKVPGPLKFMKKLQVVYKPLGVVGIITPWNGPFVLTANPAVQAMLAGNSVIVKGSEVTPYSAKIFEEFCREAGIPDGVCQVLMGDGETGAHLTAADINKISFTGSVATGKKIAMACSE
ncbi:MAG: aldehyde dehydrogenase family protein, partial [Pseudomonadales bacterium]|nr:aldehyde dehydrogenase family protein [Pseudomonadales bacterium]